MAEGDLRTPNLTSSVADMRKKEKYKPTPKAQAFLDTVVNGKYKRQIITGISKFLQGKVEGDIESLYTQSELKALAALRRLRPDMNLLMCVAVAGAMLLGEWVESGTVAALVALALTLEAWSVGRARRGARRYARTT